MKRLFIASILTFMLAWTASAEPALEFEKGDTVAVLGNALADRMQHFGWLETQLHQANADMVMVMMGYMKMRWRVEAIT